MEHDDYEEIIRENEYLRKRLEMVCEVLGNKILNILMHLQKLERREERRLNNKSNANLKDIREAIDEVRTIERTMQSQWGR